MKKGSYNERLVKRKAFCINYFQITYVLYVILLYSYITNWSVSKLKQLQLQKKKFYFYTLLRALI